MTHPQPDIQAQEKARLLLSLDSLIHEIRANRLTENWDNLWASAMDITRIASLLSKPEEEM